MVEKNQENPHIKIAIELSQKLEFYFIALAFTILGLSIQTASFIRECYQYVFEILAWCSFLVSGLAGMSRLEWLPVAYKNYDCINFERDTLNTISHGIPIGDENYQEWTEASLNSEKQRLTSSIQEKEKKINAIEKKTLIKYRIHKWAFVIGIASLIISRVILNLRKIF